MPLIPDTGHLSVLIRISIILAKVNVGKQFGRGYRIQFEIFLLFGRVECPASVYIEIPSDQLFAPHPFARELAPELFQKFTVRHGYAVNDCQGGQLLGRQLTHGSGQRWVETASAHLVHDVGGSLCISAAKQTFGFHHQGLSEAEHDPVLIGLPLLADLDLVLSEAVAVEFTGGVDRGNFVDIIEGVSHRR